MTLSHWSVVVQLGVASLLSLFFFTLARSLRLIEVRLWARAWLADTVALAAVYLAAFLASGGFPRQLSLALYLAAKTAFVVWVVTGVSQHLTPGKKAALGKEKALWIVGLWGLGLGLANPSLSAALMAQSTVVAGAFLPMAFRVWRRPRFPRSRWLAASLFLEAMLFACYVVALIPSVWGGAAAGGLLPVTSFFDAGAELVLAMSMLIALESSSTAQLNHLHAELMDSYERLRALVELDPLTGLSNRRALEVEPLRRHNQPVVVIFFDVDNFKEINDRYGHVVGDACRIRVAAAIARRFRPEDPVFRWGGDEFLVLAAGMDEASVEERFAAIVQDLEQPEEGLPPLRLSMGVSHLLPGQSLNEALAAADLAMYRARERRSPQEA